MTRRVAVVFAIGMCVLVARTVSAQAQTAPTAGCAGVAPLQFVCGPQAAEDLIPLPGTRWIVAGGYGEGGKRGQMYLIDARARTWEVLYTGGASAVDPDRRTFGSCVTPPDASFGAHGMSLRPGRRGRHLLYVVNHGREAIEVFRLDSRAAKPAVTWVGCVMAEPGVNVNSLVVLPDGGFLATKFYDLRSGVTSIFRGEITGGVHEWQPRTGWTAWPGTEVRGANGIEVSADGRDVYVAAWGAEEIVRFSRGRGPLQRQAVSLGFWPDNLKWTKDGQLLVAGQIRTIAPDRASAPSVGWKVVRLDPKTLGVTAVVDDVAGTSPLQNVATAVEAEGALWIGPFRGDRVGILPLLPPSR